MENKSPSELAQMLIEAGFAKTGPFVGCSIEDLSELEKRFSVTLPRAYKEFMIVMGQESGNFLLDGSWHYPLEWNQSTAEGMLQENDSDFVLEKDTFVFMARDNFFIFFYTNAGDDPPVYIFEDGAKQPRKFFGSFSEWLTVCVTEDVRSRTKNELAKQERTRSDDGPTVPEKIV